MMMIMPFINAKDSYDLLSIMAYFCFEKSSSCKCFKIGYRRGEKKSLYVTQTQTHAHKEEQENSHSKK